MLYPRWKIVRQALAAHKRREYFISIPTLVAQVEGVIGDALVLADFAVKDGHKLYRVGVDGRPALNKKGKPIELLGLSVLVNQLDASEYQALEQARSFFTDSFIPWRHAILHGRNTSYGNARLSVQALFILLLLAADVRAFEENGLLRVPPK